MKSSVRKKGVQELFSVINPYFGRVFFISLFTNLLVLTPSLYMLEVYDRVVNSRSHLTLLMLTILVIGLYVVLELLEWVRSRHMHEGALRLDTVLKNPVFHAIFSARLQGAQPGSIQPLNDLKAIRDFLPSLPMLSMLDVPLALFILVLLFLINPLLGWFAVGGAVVQAGIGFVNGRLTNDHLQEANKHALSSRNYADSAVRNAQVIESMAMLPGIHERWHKMQQTFLRNQAIASDYAGGSSALSRMVQMLQGSLLLGVGGWLALQGLIGGSMMIVGSILGGRLLAPIVQIITGWRQVESAHESYKRLHFLLETYPMPEKGMSLPAPKGELRVEGVFAGPPGTNLQVLKGIQFSLSPGDSLAVIGPSAAGKTTLARLLVGIWPAFQGKVRLDGVDIFSWNKEDLGPHIGYLPQDVELFEGTIAENIARFNEIDDDKVEKACQDVGIGQFINTLPERYATQIGTDGAFLSGGQRQRIGLARAIYGSPRFVVLDEPDSSLDEAGDASLLDLLMHLKQEGTTVIVITQRNNLIRALDFMLILIDGKVQKFGPREEIVASMKPKPKAAPAPDPPAVVSIPGGIR
ncbi:MAG: type I secretion system permease/ATPase [Prosthecochloris sp.]|uniref:type I secretion system permease/ATPase n=1 Tax=Prosthecochloris sp. TaxID=290513 RepID=UPI0013CCCF88|nr:type I secretion system permease/ATPase [Prosthecochloris sp.]NEX12097.1 type I secretion system permease/ATPase [Prosthecochloris sp.]